MSDPPPRSLFPPRSPDPPPGAVNVDTAARIERAVIDVFMKRFATQQMPYGQARILVALEQDLIGELVRQLAKQGDTP